MSDLTDALRSGARSLVSARLQANWRQTEYGGDLSIDNLTPQYGGQYTVEQSINDGLPGDVTLTSSSDASGTLAAPALNGRNPALPLHKVAAGGGAQLTQANFGPAKSAVINDIGEFDEGYFQLFTLTYAGLGVDAPIVIATPPGLQVLVSPVTMGNLGMIILGREWTSNTLDEDDYVVTWDQEASWNLSVQTLALLDRNGSYLRPKFTSGGGVAQAAGVTTLTTPTVNVVSKGMAFGAFVEGGGAIITSIPGQYQDRSDTAGLGAPFNTLVVLATDAHWTPTVFTGPVTLTATTDIAVGGPNAIAAVVIVEALEYPAMGAREYFSPFNEDSPLYLFDRDTAPLTLDFGIVTASGPQYERIFTGQMSDAPIKGNQASVDGVSASRLAMQRSVQVPMIHGAVHGANSTWVATYAAGSAGFFASPPPPNFSRVWMPLHGSLMYHMGAPASVDSCPDIRGTLYSSFGTGQLYRPTPVKSPWLLGMDAWQSADDAYELFWNIRPMRGWWPTNVHRYVDQLRMGNGRGLSQGYNDILSAQNARGRISFWVRGDANETTHPGYSITSGRELIQFEIGVGPTPDVAYGQCRVKCGVYDATRGAYMYINDMSNTTIGKDFTVSLPDDGMWHYVSFTYDYLNGQGKVVIDADTDDFVANILNQDDLPTLESEFEDSPANYGQGLFYVNLSTRQPMAEVALESTPWIYDFTSERNDPTLLPPLNFITAPLPVELEAPGESAPRDAWSVLVDVATTNLASYRCDEDDNLCLFPLTYLGESQMAPIASDSFERTVSGAWGSADDGGLYTVTGTPADYAVSGGAGAQTHTTLSAIHCATLGDLVNLDTDSIATVYPGRVATGSAFQLGVVARYIDASTMMFGAAQFETDGTVTAVIMSRVGGVDTPMTSTAGVGTYTVSTGHRVRMRAVGNTVQVKVWPSTMIEPPEWLASSTDPNVQEGINGLRSQTSAGLTNALPLTFTFDAYSLQSGDIEELNTAVNAQDLDVESDPTRIRNDVTVQFTETNVGSRLSAVLNYATATPILRGITTTVFTLDTPQAESAPNPVLLNLTSSQITSPNTIPAATQYVTFNSVADGSGTVYDASICSARVIDATSTSVTVRFNNQSRSTVYMTNGGDEVAFMYLLGYAVSTGDGYSSSTDQASINVRGDRTLSATMAYMQRREYAEATAAQLVSMLTQPTGTVNVHVQGDPLRKPGQVVTLADSQGTGADGLWRIVSVAHTGDLSEYTQDLVLVSIAPIGYWDINNWDQSVWGE